MAERQSRDHQWDVFHNVRCTHEYETEWNDQPTVIREKFSAWAETEKEADKTSLIHFICLLEQAGVETPWSRR